jgi:hypothetical protein
VVVLGSLLRVGFCSGGQVSGPQIRYCGYTRNVGQHAKKPTAHSGTFGFANTQSQRKKPKEPEFLSTLDRNLIN